LGAVLAAIASFWLDWEVSFGSEAIENGLSTEIIAGFPVLILAATTLLSLLARLDAGASERAKSMAALHVQYSGTCIAVVAAAAILGGLSSFSGTVMGAYVVAFSENTVMLFLNVNFGLDLAFKPAIPFIIIIAVLLLRPQGFTNLIKRAGDLGR